MPQEKYASEKRARKRAESLLDKEIGKYRAVGHSEGAHQHNFLFPTVYGEESDEKSRARGEDKDESCADLIDHNIRFHHLARAEKRAVVDIEGEGIVMIVGIIPRHALGGEARGGKPLRGVRPDLIELVVIRDRYRQRIDVARHSDILENADECAVRAIIYSLAEGVRAHNVKFAGNGRARVGIEGIVVGERHRYRRAALFVDLDRHDNVKHLSLLAARARDIGVVGFNEEGRGIVTRIIGHSVLSEVAVELG